MSVAPQTLPSGSAAALENFLLDYPEEAAGAVVLRSQDSYDFRVPKLYIIHSSPILREEVLSSPDPQPGRSVIYAEPDVEGTANVLRVVQLPVFSTILISLLSYVFPVRPILPSTTEQIMELLSVAQMYKMDVILTHIRNHIAQQQPPFIRKETAFFIYALAHKHGLRTEALQAARCTLSYSTVIIENLAVEDRLGLMPGASLHELWKYHQRVRSSFNADIQEFISSPLEELKKVEDQSCADSGLPFWLDSYISGLKQASETMSLDFANFNMFFVEHSRGLDSKFREDCEFCSGIDEEDIHALWEALMAVVQGSIAKVRLMHVAAPADRTEHDDVQAESCLALGIEGTRSENEVRLIEAPSPPKYSDMPYADVILQSSDLVNFRVHRSVLVSSSPFFRDMFSLPQPANDVRVAPDGLPVLPLSETAEVLNSLISMLYPVLPEMPQSIDNILALLAATEKYDMGAVRSLIRAEVSRRGLLSPTDSAGVFHMYAVACNKRLIPEIDTAARLSLNYPLTFESIGEALRLFDGWALRGLADFRLRCADELESRKKLFSDRKNGPSKIWAGCPSSTNPLYPFLWLDEIFWNFGRYRFADSLPTFVQFRHKFLAALQDHIYVKDCHYCLRVYTLQGEGYCAEMSKVLELPRNIPTQILADASG